MNDIALCEDKECPLNNKCRRYLTKPDEFGDVYLSESPREWDECEFYLDNNPVYE